MDNRQNIGNTNNQYNNLSDDTSLFSNYNDVFIGNNSIVDSGNNYTNKDSINFANLVNVSVKPNNQMSNVNNMVNLNSDPVNSQSISINNFSNGNGKVLNANSQVIATDGNVNSSSVDTIENEFIPQPVVVDNINLVNNSTVFQNSNSFDEKRIQEIKQKDNNSSPVVFNDGLDEDISCRKGIKGFLTNRKVISIVLVLAFIFVCVVVVKAFYFGNKVDWYEEFFVEIDKKIDEEARVYASQELDNEVLKKVAASELVSCINTKLDMDNLPDSINAVIKDINNYYNQSYNHFAFAYRDIYTGFTVSYNENQDIFTASTIKAPTDIYVYEMASMGKIDLDRELTYTPKQYVNGSGSIQYQKMYTKYKTRELLRLSTVYSDNIAHNILMDNYGRANMLDFWSKLGTTAIFKQNSNWGRINAHDALIYMSELYRFYNENDEYGTPLMNNFMNAVPKFVKGKNGYKVANKSGWTGSAIHDVSIIFADNPYIIVALSNTGNGNYDSYFNSANDLAYRLHTEYWKYKMSLCEEIKQY